jgi:L-asparagine transporter-like permease
MKNTTGTQSHSCNPKYPQVWGSLILAGATIVVVTHYLFPKAPDWISEIGILMTVAGLITIAIGSFVAHRKWAANHKVEHK